MSYIALLVSLSTLLYVLRVQRRSNEAMNRARRDLLNTIALLEEIEKRSK